MGSGGRRVVCVYYCVVKGCGWWWEWWEWWEWEWWEWERWDDAAAGQQQRQQQESACGTAEGGAFGCHVLWLAGTEVLSTDGHRSKVAGVGIIAGLMSDWVYRGTRGVKDLDLEQLTVTMTMTMQKKASSLARKKVPGITGAGPGAGGKKEATARGQEGRRGEKRESSTENGGLARVNGRSMAIPVLSPSIEVALAHFVLAGDMDADPPVNKTPTPRWVVGKNEQRERKMRAAVFGRGAPVTITAPHRGPGGASPSGPLRISTCSGATSAWGWTARQQSDDAIMAMAWGTDVSVKTRQGGQAAEEGVGVRQAV